MKKITIAIDGYSSCGKSTMAKDLAKEIGYVYVDTGAMYRSVTLYALRHQLFDEDGKVKVAELEAEMPNIHISFKFNAEHRSPRLLSQRRIGREGNPLAGGFQSRKSGGSHPIRKRGIGSPAAEDGRRQGHRDGWP